MNQEQIGLLLKKLREERNLTQEDVASNLNVGRDAIIRIEKGSRKISADELKKLSSVYGIYIDELI